MSQEAKPAVTVDVTVRMQLTAVDCSVGWPTHYLTIDGERVATSWFGSRSRFLVDGRVWQLDLVALTRAVVRQLRPQFPIQIGPAEAATSVESEEDAE